MVPNKTLLAIAGFGLFIASCTKDNSIVNQPTGLDQDLNKALIAAAPNDEGRSFFTFPDPEKNLAAIPSDPRNPITQAKVELGKRLFHETALGTEAKFEESMGKFSCASCHHAAAGFQAGVRQGISDGGVGFGFAGEGRKMDANCPEDSVDVQPIRSPSVLNSAYQKVQLWNGQFGATDVNAGTENAWTPGTPKAVNKLGYEGVEIQAIAGMPVHRLNSNPELFNSTAYRQMFLDAYGNLPEDQLYDREHIGLAVAAYERSLVATQAPFQQWLQGNFDAMTDLQKTGAVLFFGKANCSSCHTGPALNSMSFYALGMDDFNEADVLRPVDEATKKGRGGFTGNPADNYKFKVPQLYNLKQSPFYGHGSSFTSVEEVVRYKNNAVTQNPIVPEIQVSSLFKPLKLSDDEIKALTAFIEEGLFDPNLERYLPESLPSGQCFPVADDQAKADMGCN